MTVRRVAEAAFLALATLAFCALPSQSLSQEPGRAFTTDAIAPITLPAVFDDRVLLQGSVNGHTLWFHLDSGASIFAIGTDDAKAAGLTVESGASYAAPVDLIVGGIHAPAARFYVHPYGFDLDGRRVAGIFGAPLFLSFVVTVDYGRQHVIVYPRGTFDPTSTGVAPTPITITGRAPYIDVCFGATCGPFLLDMGSSMTEISAGFGRKIGLSNPIGTVDSYGFDHVRRTSAEYVAPDLTFGGIKLRGVRIAEGEDNAKRVGILGRDVLKYYAVTFDWPNSRVYLAPETP